MSIRALAVLTLMVTAASCGQEPATAVVWPAVEGRGALMARGTGRRRQLPR